VNEAKNVLIGIGGGIAAYKVCSIISSLAKEGFNVRAMLSPRAQEFITPLTISTLCRHPAYTDEEFWSASQSSPLHIELADWADLILIAPLTANTLAELSQGFAHSLLGNVVLASRVAILLAPAMNTTMWQQPVVQRNLQTLFADNRYHILGPDSGRLACDAVGVGKMSSPEDILTDVRSLLITSGRRDYAQKTVLVSAGGTREFMDPVRFIGNPSSGKMGVAIAIAACSRGADVTLIAGPGVTLPTGFPMAIRSITTAEEMQNALKMSFPSAELTVMAAAVADFKPTRYSNQKIPKVSGPSTLPLESVPDLIQGLSNSKKANQRLIGFAAQTGDILAPAQAKLIKKGLDAIVANPIDQKDAGFDSDRNQAIWLDQQSRQIELPLMSKLDLAHRILDLALDL
jgi:phosphopantothenoylcysteine decarboxylase / phosphopantothenate---cysteine ligase